MQMGVVTRVVATVVTDLSLLIKHTHHVHDCISKGIRHLRRPQKHFAKMGAQNRSPKLGAQKGSPKLEPQNGSLKMRTQTGTQNGTPKMGAHNRNRNREPEWEA